MNLKTRGDKSATSREERDPESTPGRIFPDGSTALKNDGLE